MMMSRRNSIERVSWKWCLEVGTRMYVHMSMVVSVGTNLHIDMDWCGTKPSIARGVRLDIDWDLW